MNHGSVPVRQKPLVAIMATGDELVPPGTQGAGDKIVASNAYAIAALVEGAGGRCLDLGIVGDELAAIEAAIGSARSAAANILVTLGGASVGDHDLVKPALSNQGMALDFWRIAMRPGKPLIHGRLEELAVLGFPGNPVSAIVCGLLFLVPLVRALSGDPAAGTDRSEPAVLGGPLPGNDNRQDYLRAALALRADGVPVATASPVQDSSMLRRLAEAECLIVRGPFAKEDASGAPCRILRLPKGF
jgi:molybdopterin molybdotransferase